MHVRWLADDVDVHHHAILPTYRATLEAWGIGAQPNIPFPAWNPEDSLRWMDGAGVRRAILSVGSPGFHFGDLGATVALTAECNAELAGLRDRWPERFDAFAALPLPDVDAACAQAEVAIRRDGFAGVGLLTSYDGELLGASEWDPLLASLDAMSTLVHVHPTIPKMWDDSVPLRPSLIEYPFETTRAIVELARLRIFSRFPSVRWIFSHGGGAFAVLADRISGGQRHRPIAGGDCIDDVLAVSSFDSALVGGAGLAALNVTVGPERVLYGSDLPFVEVARVASERSAWRRMTPNE